MSTATKKLDLSSVDHSTAMRELEDKVKGEISELLLLMKSGILSVEEKARLKERLDKAILQLEISHKECCKK